jgi:hypothetical protein
MAKKKEKKLDQMFRDLSEEYLAKREYIRRYDNEKIGVENWYGLQEYRHLNFDAVDARIQEIVLEKTMEKMYG